MLSGGAVRQEPTRLLFRSSLWLDRRIAGRVTFGID
jgi:hypothetical protein